MTTPVKLNEHVEDNVKVLYFLLGGVVLIFILVGLTTPDNSKDPATAIAESCQQQFGTEGQDQVTNCRIRLMAKRIQESEDGKLERADRQSR